MVPLWWSRSNIHLLHRREHALLPGNLQLLHPARSAGVLLLTVVLRRVFCGYMCPIGTISEWLQSGVRRVIRLKPARVPAGLDRALSLLKYVALAVILYFTWTRAELEFRRADPCYALISRHGEDITFWAYVVAGAIVVASLFIVMPFCRWLCPFAAVLNVFSRFGLTRISRDPDTCIDCGQCARSCPTAIPVDKQLHSTNARCISCMNCLSVCPKLQEGALRWGPRSSSRRGWPSGSNRRVNPPSRICICGRPCLLFQPHPSPRSSRAGVLTRLFPR